MCGVMVQDLSRIFMGDLFYWIRLCIQKLLSVCPDRAVGPIKGTTHKKNPGFLPDFTSETFPYELVPPGQ